MAEKRKRHQRNRCFDAAYLLPEYNKWVEEQKPAWTSSKIRCDLCGHEWVAVHHIESDRLECPRCHNMTIFE